MKKSKSHFLIIPILLLSLIFFNSSKNKEGSSNTDNTDNAAGTVTDADGNVYKTVVIGNREWMAENLRTTKFNDGTEIPNVTSRSAWTNLSTPGYCWYENDREKYAQPYGAMYNWYAVETGKLCPEGWRVPSRTEFNSYLREALGGVSEAGAKIKSTGTIEDGTGLWLTPNVATNESGFTAVPNGLRHPGGSFQYLGMLGYLWTSSLNPVDDQPENPGRITLSHSSPNFLSGWVEKTSGFGVRCIRDNY